MNNKLAEVVDLEEARDKIAFAEAADALSTNKCNETFHVYPGTAVPGDLCQCGSVKFLEELLE